MIPLTVGQRSGEIGVRIALGARASDVRPLVVGEGVRLALIGIGLGAIAAAAGTRLLRDMLYGATPGDPATFLACAVILGVVAFVASYLPSRRASSLDPLVALRSE